MQLFYLFCVLILFSINFTTSDKIDYEETYSSLKAAKKYHGEREPRYALLLTPLMEDCKKKRLKNVIDFISSDIGLKRFKNVKHVELSTDVFRESSVIIFNTKKERDAYTVSGSDTSKEDLIKLLQQQLEEDNTEQDLKKKYGIVYEFPIENLPYIEVSERISSFDVK